MAELAKIRTEIWFETEYGYDKRDCYTIDYDGFEEVIENGLNSCWELWQLIGEDQAFQVTDSGRLVWL